MLVQVAATLVVCEIAVRALTTTHSDTGMPMIGGYALLPYRPDPGAVRAAFARAGTYLVRDEELGWTVGPHGRARDGLYESNAEGARAPAESRYGERPPAGRLRVVTVGDSFTHGDSVALEDTWQREMERRRSDLEVVNLGVPGYGTDQAYLRWRRDGARLRPQLALLGIWPENICRNLNVVRFFFQPAGGLGFLSKPRFLLDGGRLQPITEPVLDGEPLLRALSDPGRVPVLAHDYWAIADDLQPHAWQHVRLARVAATLLNLHHRRELRQRLYAGTDPAGIDVTVAIAEAFRRDAEARGAVPIVVVIPMVDLLERYPAEDSLPLVRSLRAKDLEVVDLGPPMARQVRAHGVASCYAEDRHLSAEGNRLLAGWLLDRLAPRLDQERARQEADRAAPTSASAASTGAVRAAYRP